MKKNRKLKHLMLFASSGAIVCTGSAAFANDSVQALEGSETYQIEKNVDVRTDVDSSGAQFSGRIMDEPAGAERTYQTSTSTVRSFGTVHRASDLIGMEVRNQRNEKLGDIRDVMIDTNTGRVPFAILSSDAGNRLVALPPSALQTSGNNQLLLNIDRDRLRAAPSFERNRWPDMSSQQWSSEVYRFYGVPYQHSQFQSQPYQYRSAVVSESVLEEPAGATLHSSTTHSYSDQRELGEVEGITRLDDISGNRSRGGAVDLQPFAHRNEGPVGRSVTWQESSTVQQRTYPQERRHSTTTRMSHTGYQRASDLIGMNIRNERGEVVGEIRDVVLDLNSGHVAYTVINADRYVDGDGLIAVPPALLVSGSDARTLTLRADRNMLMNAPRFERDNWHQVSSERYVQRVYSHYGQQPYWQAQGQFRQGTQMREPSGAELNQNYQYQHQQDTQSLQNGQPSLDQSLHEQQRSQTFEQQQQLSEPAGAELQSEEPERSISEPSGAEPAQPAPDTQSSATLETQEAQQQSQSAPSAGFRGDESSAATESSVDEPAGAQPGTQQESQPAPQSQQSIEPGEQTQPDQSSAITSPQAGAELESEVNVHSDTPAGGFVQEPAGAEPQAEQYPVPTRTRGEEFNEPSGAQQSQQSLEINESAGADSSAPQAVDTHAQQVQDAAGAAPGSSASATSRASADPQQRLVQQVQTTLKNDSSLQAQGIQVSTENGKIVLQGSVNSETQKQQIEERVQDVILENRIQVQGSQQQSGTPSQP